MLTLHLATKNYSSWSLRPWLVMKANDIPFDEVVHPFVASQAGSSFAALSPTARLPLLTDGEHAIWDSLAICEYLAESYPGVWPAEKTARAWARSVSAEMHSGFITLRSQCPMNIGLRVRLHRLSDELKRDIERIDQLWCEGLERFHGPWLAGASFSAADAFFGPVAFRCQTYGLPLSSAASSYLERLLNHPTMREWQQQALQDPCRDAAHETSTARFGQIIDDVRF